MDESGPEEEKPIIDISVNTDNDEDNAAAETLLAALDIEHVVQRTLQTVRVKQTVMLTLVISGDTEIQALNRQYRQQDKPTDVLSFPLLDQPLVKAPPEWLWPVPQEQGSAEKQAGSEQEVEKPLFVTPDELGTNLGDIMISWPTVQRQASEAGHTVAYELLFLLCHGILHLVGYDDQTEAGYREMLRLQQEILAAIPQKG